MGDTQLELVCNGSDPRIILCFKHLLRTSQIQIACKHRQIDQIHHLCSTAQFTLIAHANTKAALCITTVVQCDKDGKLTT